MPNNTHCWIGGYTCKIILISLKVQLTVMISIGLYVVVILVFIFTPGGVSKVVVVHYTANIGYNNFESQTSVYHWVACHG